MRAVGMIVMVVAVAAVGAAFGGDLHARVSPLAVAAVFGGMIALGVIFERAITRR